MPTGLPQTLSISEGGTGAKNEVDAKTNFEIPGLIISGNGAGNEITFGASALTSDRVYNLVNASGSQMVLVVKNTTGNPTGFEGMVVFNSTDSTLKLFAGGAYRTIAYT